jgi:hypothetical protein
MSMRRWDVEANDAILFAAHSERVHYRHMTRRSLLGSVRSFRFGERRYALAVASSLCVSRL